MPQEFIAPAASAPVSVTPNNTAWANSNYAELTASTSEARYLAGLVVIPDPNLFQSAAYEIDIATGAAASEVVVATIRGHFHGSVGDAGGPKYHALPILGEYLANGVRVAVRMRKSTSGTTAWNFAYAYTTAVDSETESTTAPYLTLPSAAVGAGTTMQGSAWAYSGYGQITASMANNSVITSVTFEGNGMPGDNWEIEIAFGASSSEVVQMVLPFRHASGHQGNPLTIILPNPLEVPSGTRVSWRHRRSGTTSSGNTVRLSINILEGTTGGRQTTTGIKITGGGGAGTTLNTSGSNWTFGTWTELVASSSNTTDIAGIAFCATSVLAGVWIELQIGTGAGGAETSIGTFYGYANSAGGGGYVPTWMAEKPFGNIAAGTRISARWRVSTTAGSPAALVKLLYYEDLGSSSTWRTSNTPVNTPSGATPSNITGGTSWANGSWVQLDAAVATDFVLRGVTFLCPLNNNSFEIDIGTGASSSEAVITTVRGYATNPSGDGAHWRIPVPAVLIASGTRIAARVRVSGGSGGTWQVGVYGTNGVDAAPSTGGGPLTDSRLAGRGWLTGARLAA